MANPEELSSDDETTSNFSEDLSDSHPVNIPELSADSISDPTIFLEPISDSVLSNLTIPTASDSQETTPVPLISLVSAEAFIRSMQLEGAQCFSIMTHDPMDPKIFDKPKFNPDLDQVPEIYHEFADVFAKQKADTLLPHHDCDLKINIEDGSKPLSGIIYPLSTSELKTLWEFIDDNLKTGFIWPSNSLFGAPVLFVKKKDRSLQLCVDFRRLNAITQKDKYPLPLTSELLDSPSKAKVFTKIDLKHAHHLVRIAAGDEWKTTF